MIKVIYNKVCGRCVQSEPLTSGMVGQPIEFEYSSDFDGLAVTAVFTDGKNTVDVVNPGNECVIPHEVLTTVGAMVKVGVYAVKGDKLVIPTIYAHIGVVLKGADPSGDVSIDPTLPIWAQTQALIGNLSQIETETKDSLVAAINEVKQTADRKANAADLAPVATSGNYNDLSNKPTIPAPVTEQTVSGWGFTKNTGTYSKPAGGIPKADLAAAVQTSLGKADTALQEHQSLAAYRTAAAQDVIDSSKVDKITGKGLSTNDYTNADKAKVNDLKSVATSGSYNDLTDKPAIPSIPTATIEANAAARHEHSNKTVLDLISETVKAAWDAASTWVTTNGANVLSHLSDGVKHITAAERSAWNGKQDKLIAGDNITIAADGKTISATGAGGGSGLEPPIKTGSLLRGDADNGKWSEVDADGGYGYTDGQKTVIEWDGNASGKAEVYFTGVYYYNVSEKVPSLEELIGGIAVGRTETRPLTISSENCAAMGGIISIINIYKDLSILVVPNDNFHFEYSAGGMSIEADFPKKGVYFAKDPDITIDFVHSLTYGNEIVHQIAEKYLPEVVLSGDKEIILSSSTTDSTKKFKITVDDTGTLSATEVTA